MTKQLTPADYQRAAEMLGCRRQVIQAVAQVEAVNSGFLPSGRVTILFEAHQFSRLTGHRYDTSHPSISSKVWNRALYRAYSVDMESAQSFAKEQDHRQHFYAILGVAESKERVVAASQAGRAPEGARP